MVGMLDTGDPNLGYGIDGMPEPPREEDIDYSNGFPVRTLKRARTGEERMSTDLDRFRETQPVSPVHMPQMDPGQPLPGILNAGGALNTIQPPGPPPAVAPGSPAPPLPAPVNVGAPPGAPPVAPGGPNVAAQGGKQPDPYETAQSAIPQKAQPIQGQGMPGAPTMPQRQPGMLEGFDNWTQQHANTLLSLASGFAGAPSFGTGMSRAFGAAPTGIQADMAQTMKVQAIQDTFRALVESGMPRQQALAAAQNPEIFKLAAPDYMGTRKSEIKVVKDSLGNERLVAVNPYMDQAELDRRQGLGGGAGGGEGGIGTNVSGGADTSQLGRMPIEIDPNTGRDEKFLAAFKAADPVNEMALESVLEGNLPATGRNMQQLLRYAGRAEPGFNNATYTARQNLYKSYYGGGKGFEQIKAANTAIDHGLQLRQAIENLHNYTTMPGFMNKATGTIAEQFSPGYQRALAAFDKWRTIYAHELETALTGKSTVTGTREIADQFDRYGSPEKNLSALTTSLEGLQERIHEHEASFNRGMGGKASSSPVKDFVTNQPRLEQLLRAEEARIGGQGGTPPAAAAPRGAPPPGVYNYDPKTGTMVPAR